MSAQPAEPSPDAIELRVNGAPRRVRAGLTIAELVAELGLRPEIVAVERNRELVPRARHAHTRLEGGDELEIVALVGGG